jgi:hypothetical protein
MFFLIVYLNMKSKNIKKDTIESKESNSITTDSQKLFSERMERFMSLVELSYALKTSPRIIQKK